MPARSQTDVTAALLAQREASKSFLSFPRATQPNAEGLLQNGLLKALQRASGIKDSEKAGAWLYRVLPNSSSPPCGVGAAVRRDDARMSNHRLEDVRAGLAPLKKQRIIEELRGQSHWSRSRETGSTTRRHLPRSMSAFAMGTGPAVAIESGHHAGERRSAPRAHALELSRRVLTNIRQNLFLALVYNGAGVPLAAGGLYPIFVFEHSEQVPALALARD